MAFITKSTFIRILLRSSVIILLLSGCDSIDKSSNGSSITAQKITLEQQIACTSVNDLPAYMISLIIDAGENLVRDPKMIEPFPELMSQMNSAYRSDTENLDFFNLSIYMIEVTYEISQIKNKTLDINSSPAVKSFRVGEHARTANEFIDEAKSFCREFTG